MANYVTYPRNVSGRPDGIPPVASEEGGYYYKYSYSWTSKAASTEVNLCDAIMKFDSTKNNNGYIFLSCVGTSSTPPEFGIYTTPDLDGKWCGYRRVAGSGVIENLGVVINPDPNSVNSGIYTYNNAPRIKIKIKLSGSSIIGEILRVTSSGENTIIPATSVSGSGSGIGGTTNTFLLGTSFVPNPPTTNCGNRDAYLKHVYLHEGYLYETASFGNPTEWVPDPANPVTYYSIVVRPEHTTYNRFGSRDEEISIDYN